MIAKLRDYCLDIGFDLFGTVKPERNSGFDKYKKWLKEGNHAELKWMENNLEKREDPRLILDGCKSIIVLGCSYFNHNYSDAEINDSDLALMARYAWGDDYHEVLRSKLFQITEYIDNNFKQPASHQKSKVKSQKSCARGAPALGGKPHLKTQNQDQGVRLGRTIGDFEHKYYTDTGPILEKWLAHEAGLGFQGKNSCLINNKIGSYFFISTILTTLPLPEYKEKVIGSCGDCRRCIDACPTGAINNNKTIDARKCISYHTIENKGEIPPNIKSKIKNRVFGCDICQEVCPWNKFAQPTRVEEFKTKNERDKLKISQLREMEKEEYQRLLKKSAVKRAGFKGLKRNCK